MSPKKKKQVKVFETEEGKGFKCEICDKKFTKKINLTPHVRTHTLEKPFKCSLCEKSFAQQGALRHHSKAVHEKCKDFYCVFCPKLFSSKADQFRHLLRHTGETPYNDCSSATEPRPRRKCQVCNKYVYNLTVHMLTHSQVKGFKCEICDASFKLKCSLNAHTKTHTGEKPYKCEYCKRSFSQKYHLRYHNQTHTGEKPYHCDKCDKSFSRKSVLKLHCKLVHGKCKELSCVFCEKLFAHKTTLRVHILRRHIKEKPFHCQVQVCGKSFYSSTECSQHWRRIHAGENKPFNFKCDICHRSFNQKQYLRTHRKVVHEKRKEFFCIFCPRLFALKQNMEGHLLRHIEERPFSCLRCGASFYTNSERKQHLNRVNPCTEINA